MKNVLKIFFAFIICLIIGHSCGTVKPVPVKEEIIYTYRDSVNYKDSVIYHHLYKEFYKDYTGYLDTLQMETSYATAKAFLDTTNHIINGEMQNKDIYIPVQIKWKERLVYRDSLVKVEVPVEVTKEVKTHFKYEKWLWLYSIILTVIFGLAIYIKVKH